MIYDGQKIVDHINVNNIDSKKIKCILNKPDSSSKVQILKLISLIQSKYEIAYFEQHKII